MAAIFRRIGPWGLSWLMRVMIVLGICLYGAVLLTISFSMNWWEVTIIAGAIAILLLGLLWSIDEMKRLNRD